MADATGLPTVDLLMKDFMYKVSGALANLNMFNQVVESDDDPNNVASSEATFVFSGPPVAKASYGTTNRTIASLLRPIGAVQQINVNEGKQILPFRELGSKLLRQATGATQYSANISRVLTRHSNIKYSCYRWLFDSATGTDMAADDNSKGLAPLGIKLARVPSDNSRHFVGMESELYNIPFGLLIIVGTAGGGIISAEYLEKCHIANAGNSKQVGNTMIVDNLALTVSRSVPFVTESGAAGIDFKADSDLLRGSTARKLFAFTPTGTGALTVVPDALAATAS